LKFSSLSRHPLKRHYGQGDLHFITFSCYQRKPLLGTPETRDTFVEILDEVRCRHAFALFGYVVMPEHVHLVVSEPEKKTPSKALQVLKQNVAKSLLTVTQRPAFFAFSSPSEDARTDQHFWHRRFYDFNVWSEQKLHEKLNYIHANPVVRKLVSHPKDWPWSSWTHYAIGQEGRIKIDSISLERRYQDESEAGIKRQNPHP
jgi:putative transposase